MSPINGREVCFVDDLEWRLDDIVRVSESGLSENIRRFDDCRGNNMEA